MKKMKKLIKISINSNSKTVKNPKKRVSKTIAIPQF